MLALAALLVLATATPDTAVVPMKEIVVSATKTPREPINIPNSVAVIRGGELRRRATATLADALQDIVGLDTGSGSDNGSRLPNIGMWGLKEFDALLVTLDGVPVGGPFNPSLSQIAVDDLDRIEIVKGPQGTLYGVSAFAGMVQAFSRTSEIGKGHVTAGGGSFSDWHGNAGVERSLGEGASFRLFGSGLHSDGWQDRTTGELWRGSASWTRPFGAGSHALTVTGYRDQQDWGTPLPFDAGEIVPGFKIDRNYAVRGAEVQHRVLSGVSRLTWPIGGSHRLENTLSFTHDKQNFIRSFPGAISGDAFRSVGVELAPTENALYEDVRAIWNLKAGGDHEVVTGAALTWGETKGAGSEFQFDQSFSNYAGIPTLAEATRLDDHDFEDMRRFIGVYAHDSWTPAPRFTLSGGGRFDAIGEELETEQDTPDGPEQVKDTKDDHDFSGDISALVRLVPDGEPRFQAANLYASVRRAFKPAAPNLAEAEAAEILDPETTTSWEVGLKTHAFDQLQIDVSYFDMDFKNMVVSILGSGGAPELMNAGEQRFKGFETGLRWAPKALPGAAIDLGFAHHDAKFVDFTFVTPDGQFRDVSGKRLELVPRDLFNAKLQYAPAEGFGAFVAARHQGERPLNRRNTFFTDAFTEWDAGASYAYGSWMLVVSGRNLGDQRNPVTESEIGDSQFYIAAPRRVTAELTARF